MNDLVDHRYSLLLPHSLSMLLTLCKAVSALGDNSRFVAQGYLQSGFPRPVVD